MNHRSTALAIALAVALPGCFLEVSADGYGANGGVRGAGYGVGLGFGVYLDPAPVMVSVGGDYRGVRAHGNDGRYASSEAAVAVRADVDMIGDDETVLRATGVFEHSANTALKFTPDTIPKTYDGKGHTTAVLVGLTGLTRKGDNGFAVTLGPTVRHVSNDFVGDTTLFGFEGRFTLYWGPSSLGKVFANYQPSESKAQDNRSLDKQINDANKDAEKEEEKSIKHSTDCAKGSPACP